MSGVRERRGAEEKRVAGGPRVAVWMLQRYSYLG